MSNKTFNIEEAQGLNHDTITLIGESGITAQAVASAVGITPMIHVVPERDEQPSIADSCTYDVPKAIDIVKTTGSLDETIKTDSAFTNVLELMNKDALEVFEEFGIEYVLSAPDTYRLSDIFNIIRTVNAESNNWSRVNEKDLWMIIYKNIGISHNPFEEVYDTGGKYPIKLTMLDHRYGRRIKGDVEFNRYGFIAIIATYISNPFNNNHNHTQNIEYVDSIVLEIKESLIERGVWDIVDPIMSASSISLHSKLQLFKRIEMNVKKDDKEACRRVMTNYAPEVR